MFEKVCHLGNIINVHANYNIEPTPLFQTPCSFEKTYLNDLSL